MDQKNLRRNRVEPARFYQGSGRRLSRAGNRAASDSGGRSRRLPRRGPTRNCAACLLGAIKPEGWLRLHMEGQAKLASALPEISYPFFSGTFWEGEENSPAWFTWEQKAYWVDGATRLALALGRRQIAGKRTRFSRLHA